MEGKCHSETGKFNGKFFDLIGCAIKFLFHTGGWKPRSHGFSLQERKEERPDDKVKRLGESQQPTANHFNTNKPMEDTILPRAHQSHIARLRQLSTNYRNRSNESYIHVLTSSDSPSPFSPAVAAALSKSVPSSLMINLNSFTGTGIIVHCSGAIRCNKNK